MLPETFQEAIGFTFLVLFWFLEPMRGRMRPPGAAASNDQRFVVAMRRQPLPPAVFGVVWTVLYFLIAYAHFAYVKDAPDKTSSTYGAAIILFGVNWVLNKAWYPTFFDAQAPAAGFVVIVGVWGTAIALTAIVWSALDTLTAPLFLLAYTLWLTVATGLNAYIWSVYARLPTTPTETSDEKTVAGGVAARAPNISLAAYKWN